LPSHVAIILLQPYSGCHPVCIAPEVPITTISFSRLKLANDGSYFHKTQLLTENFQERDRSGKYDDLHLQRSMTLFVIPQKR